MELTPLRPFFRSGMIGLCAGLAVTLGVFVWKVLREGNVGGAALALLASSVACGTLFGWFFTRYLRRSVREARPAPADARLGGRGLSWLFVLTGSGLGISAIGRHSADNGAVWAGVLAGLGVGGAIGFFVALRWITAWERAHGQELFQNRGSRKQTGTIYTREPGSGRFERGAREREPAPS